MPLSNDAPNANVDPVEITLRDGRRERGDKERHGRDGTE